VIQVTSFQGRFDLSFNSVGLRKNGLLPVSAITVIRNDNGRFSAAL